MTPEWSSIRSGGRTRRPSSGTRPWTTGGAVRREPVTRLDGSAGPAPAP